MEEPAQRLVSPVAVLRVVLVAFVLAWLFGPYALRSAVPIWLPFLIALGLELHFFVGAPPAGAGRARRTAGRRRSTASATATPSEPDELLLVRDGGEELWIPYSGETDEELEALIEEARERPSGGGRLRRRRAAPARGRPCAGFARRARRDRRARAAALVRRQPHRLGRARRRRRAPRPTARFSDEASRIAGEAGHDPLRRVRRLRRRRPARDGVAAVGGDLAYLTPERCLDLYRLAFEAR